MDTNGVVLVQGLDARVELILSTGRWLARMGSKQKSLSEITNVQVQKNNHANLL